MTTEPIVKPRRKRRTAGPKTRGGSMEARKLAAVILEVLAGSRMPVEAAQAVGVSLTRYYLLEARALQGLLDACEPRKLGPKTNPERECQKLRREMERLKRESARSQALLRLSQRTVGLPKAETERPKQKGKRRRRPVVRALRAAQRLQSASEDHEDQLENAVLQTQT